MKRHLKSCTGESPDMTSQLDDENSYKDVDPTIKINGTKGWRKGKSKYTPYYYINKEIGQVNITTISQNISRTFFQCHLFLKFSISWTFFKFHLF